jgi:hypothetical protein
MEVFKFYKTYQKHNYEVSNYGRVKKDGIIIPYEKLSNWGNYKEVFWHNTVHKAVGLLFVDNPENKPEIDHIDGNPLNNHYTNLRWVTHSENIRNPITINRMIKSLKEYYSDEDVRKKQSDKMKLFWQTERGKEIIKLAVLPPCFKKGYQKSEKHLAKIADKLRGRTFSQAIKDNISIGTKKAMESPEVRAKCILGGLHTKGLRWMNNGVKNIRVEPDKINEFIELGYTIGRGKITF